MQILVSGAAGFIGYNLCKFLSEKKINVVGIDNINSYYDIKLKKNRIKDLKKFKNFQFYKVDINNKNKIFKLFKVYNFKYVIHLAAQAGVRKSVHDPDSYFKNNIEGFYNILKISKDFKLKHLIFASSSSVYGKKLKNSSSESDNTDKPLSFYAASKKTNEIMAYSFSNIYNLPVTSLRLFTVYGPNGRPDMAIYKFVNKIKSGAKISLYNKGNNYRDFTYIEDVVNAIYLLIFKPSKKQVPYNCFNIGSNNPQKISKILDFLKKKLNVQAKIQTKKQQIGEVKKTNANINKIKKYIKFKNKVKINEGLDNFLKWFNIQ